ncbi:MAG: hypothetical protein GYB47_00755 [Rhodospirillales bacterium]|nr:hypothetical protein [Rhodospirillales bacterium]
MIDASGLHTGISIGKNWRYPSMTAIPIISVNATRADRGTCCVIRRLEQVPVEQVPVEQVPVDQVQMDQVQMDQLRGGADRKPIIKVRRIS